MLVPFLPLGFVPHSPISILDAKGERSVDETWVLHRSYFSTSLNSFTLCIGHFPEAGKARWFVNTEHALGN